jgi:hypothetical protein
LAIYEFSTERWRKLPATRVGYLNWSPDGKRLYFLRDVIELVTAIEDYVDHHNEHPKPFIWTASATDILEKVKRARKTLVNVQSV